MNDLPDPSEAWAEAQRGVAEKLAQKYYEIYERLLGERFPGSEGLPWGELDGEHQELLVDVCHELLFGEDGGDLVVSNR